MLRLERSFTDSKNLGDFLRREKVIAEREVARGTNVALLVAVAALAVATGWLLHGRLPL